MTPQEKGRLYEKRLQKEGRAKCQPFSGAAHYAKEDLTTEHELIQCKYHEPSQSMSIYQEWFDDLRRHAAQIRRMGALFLWWNNKEYVILRREDYDSHVIFDEHLCKLCKSEEPVVCKSCLKSKLDSCNSPTRTKTSKGSSSVSE